jgi:hypothetical protein
MPPRKTNEPFRRVKPQQRTSEQLELDNRYEVKVPWGSVTLIGIIMWNCDLQAAPTNDYGAKAHKDLIVTRGAGFRKEKNKKKRGSYRGGEITVRVDSYCILTMLTSFWV